jgi:hypothetical protein
MNVIPKENLINLEGLTREQVTLIAEAIWHSIPNQKLKGDVRLLTEIATELNEYLLNTM